MKANKKLVMIISFALVMSNVPAAFAAEKPSQLSATNVVTSSKENVSKDKTVKENLIKKSKNVLEDCFNFKLDESKYDINVEREGHCIEENVCENNFWRVSWCRKNSDVEEGIVIIDSSNGDIVTISVMGAYSSTSEKPTLNEEEAQKISESMLKKLASDKIKDIRIEKYDYADSNTIGFKFVRVKDGVECDFDGGVIEIDTASKKPVYYYLNWTKDLEFDKKDKFISKETAKKYYENNLDMTLSYILNPKNNNEAIPVYMADFSKGNNLDAKESKFFNGYDVNEETKTYSISKEDMESLVKKYSKRESSKKLSESDAKTLAVKLSKEISGKDFKVAQIQYMPKSVEEMLNENVWVIELEDNKNAHGTVVLNADTGKLIGIYTEPDLLEQKDFKPVINWNQAYNKAIDAITQYYPEKLSKINTVQVVKEISKIDVNDKFGESEYHFTFNRVENGITYSENDIYVEVNPKNGKISMLGSQWNSDLKFRDSKNILDKAKARKSYLNNYDFKIFYVRDYNTNKVKLAYNLVPVKGYVGQIDANTGKTIEY